MRVNTHKGGEFEGLRVYSTCPQSKDSEPGLYLDRLGEVAGWSEQAGCEGILVYTDNGLVDPWLAAQEVIRATDHLVPLVAVQPIYMHPYSAAKMVASIAFLHRRRVDLNLLAGGFKNDLIALGDETAHDDRYLRTTEYAQIVLALLRGETVSFEGAFYRVENLRLKPELPTELMPRALISGSSPAGAAAAQVLEALPVKYPKPPGEEEPPEGRAFGFRVGMIARETEAEAWRVAHERFPPDRRGEVAHKMAMSVSDSHWHRQLSSETEAGEGPYWLHPFQTYKTFCPYLVGEHARVAEEVAGYVELGADTIILDIPPSREELEEIGKVFNLVESKAAI